MHHLHTGLQAQYVLYKQRSLESPGEVLLDPNVLAADGTASLNTYALTEDGELLAYGISQVRHSHLSRPVEIVPFLMLTPRDAAISAMGI